MPYAPVTCRPTTALAVLFALILQVGVCLAQAPAEGTSPPPSPEETLLVGVTSMPPYARREDDGTWQGLAVNVWRTAAEEAGLSYRLVEVPGDTLTSRLASGELDAALPVVADPALTREVSYAFPFYTATLGIAEKRQSAVLKTALRLWSVEFGRIILYLSGLLLVIGTIIWLLERTSNEEQFHRSPLKGLGDGFWWAGVTLTTIGYGDKAPRTFFGRAVAMLWMLIGLAVSATLTAAVVSAMDLSGEGSTLSNIGGRSVGAAEGTGAYAYLEGQGLDVRGLPSLEAGLRAVEEGELDLFVHNAPPLKVAASEMNLNLKITTTSADPEPVTIAVPEGSPLERTLDAAIIERTTAPGWWDQVRKWVPEE
jgi:ABC-type amino acid transport substrate-binding protein